MGKITNDYVYYYISIIYIYALNLGRKKCVCWIYDV